MCVDEGQNTLPSQLVRQEDIKAKVKGLRLIVSISN